jgi:hypothetical protein
MHAFSYEIGTLLFFFLTYFQCITQQVGKKLGFSCFWNLKALRCSKQGLWISIIVLCLLLPAPLCLSGLVFLNWSYTMVTHLYSFPGHRGKYRAYWNHENHDFLLLFLLLLFFVCLFVYLFVLRQGVAMLPRLASNLLCSPGRPWTHDAAVSASQVLEFRHVPPCPACKQIKILKSLISSFCCRMQSC